MKNCESITTNNEELKNLNEYLRHQLGESMKQKRKILANYSSSPGSAHEEESESDNHPVVSYSEEEHQKRPRRGRRYQLNINNFRGKALEIEDKLNPNDFSECLHTVERLFDFVEIREEKKVKVVALMLGKVCILFSGLTCVPKEFDKKREH